MKRAGLAATLALTPGEALAHGVVEGVGDIYAGLLHPLLVPGEALTLLALALLMGSSGLNAARFGIPALAAGLAVGLLAGAHVPSALATPPLLAVALVAAALVAAGARLAPVAVAVLAAAAGVAVGVDAHPESNALRPALVGGAATVLGGTALTLAIAALVLGRTALWQRVAVRVAGSWIVATAVLYLALTFGEAWSGPRSTLPSVAYGELHVDGWIVRCRRPMVAGEHAELSRVGELQGALT